MADEKNKGTPITLDDEVAGGVYANGMKVWHTKEEFILDFFMMAPVKGRVSSRVIISPGHLKRIIAVLQSTFERFESESGEIEIAEEPSGSIGGLN